MSLLRITLACLLFVHCSHAQDSASVHVNAGLLYNSGLNYYGRVDSLKSKGICPLIGLSLKNGLYINSTFVFVENSLQSQYAAAILEAGYNWYSGKYWAANLSVSRFFYQPDIGLVESTIRDMASVSVSQLNNIANITLTGSVRWSDQADYNLQAGLDHVIRIPKVLGKKGVLVFDPTATVSAGTQNFTTTYYQERKILFFPAQAQEITVSSKQFNILAYELSCPIVYGLGKIKLMLTPAYVLPQHVITSAEIGSNLFYVTAMAKVTL